MLIKRIGRTAGNYFLLFCAIFIIFNINYSVRGGIFGSYSRFSMLFAIIIMILLWIILMPRYCLENWLKLILTCGIFMRVSYMLQTAYNVRVHDLGSISLTHSGHASYIYWLYKVGDLPATNQGQFYNPPFYHWLCAQVLKIFQCFHKQDDIVVLFQSTKLVSCFASCVTLIVIYKICNNLNIPDRSKPLIIGLMAFYPNFYLMAGRVNNDSLAFLFIMMIILFGVRWYHTRDYLNMIGLALSFGFGIMTKINVAVMAVLVAPLFVVVLIRNIREKKGYHIGQFITFSVISLPMALWYPVRNLLVFKQPLNYVYKLQESSMYYRGNVSFIKRFLPVQWKRLFYPVYNDVDKDFNIPNYIIKSSLFGEFSFENVDEAKVLIGVNIALIIISLVSMGYMIYYFRKTRKQMVIGMFLLWLTLLVSYVGFNITYPFSTTMDYRYIGPTSFIGVFFLGLTFHVLWEKDTVPARVCSFFIAGLSVVFVILSVAIYCIV